jgi:nicotinic acid phosphoribosyltransferase
LTPSLAYPAPPAAPGTPAQVGDAPLRFFCLISAAAANPSPGPGGCKIRATEWGEKALAHYKKLRIDAQAKRLTFSDGLDLPTSLALYGTFAERTQTGFGIGTNLTNDLGVPALNIVMKPMSCNGQPTAKLSDTPGKTLCEDETFLSYLRQVFGRALP